MAPRRWSDQFRVRQATADDARHRHAEPIRIRHVFALVEAERLLIEIPEQVKRLDADVGARASARLSKLQIVFQAVGVDVAVHVSLGVVDDVVNVAALRLIVVGQQRIGVDGRAGFDVLVTIVLAS